MTLSEAVQKIRGKPGSKIALMIVRNEEQKRLSITRDIIKIVNVKSKLLNNAYGYIRISSFLPNTSDQIGKSVKKLQTLSKSKLRGLILDLRNNPGGLLSAAVNVSDAFLQRGLIVYTEGREERFKQKYNARRGDILNGAPIVVLINKGSAAASEIVAGALQDHKRAVIMGQTSYGKGSLQTIFSMSDNSAIKITTAGYYTPSGDPIHAKGIRPDIILEQPDSDDALLQAIKVFNKR
jgi:carboxyl-terminal processing protease